MHSEWLGLIPHMFLAGGGILIWCAGAFWAGRSRNALFIIAVAAVSFSGISAGLVAPEKGVFSGMIESGGYARFFTFLFCCITLLTLFFCHQYTNIRERSGDVFLGVMLFAALGMSLMAGALNWVIFFLGLELLSVSFYILIAFGKNTRLSGEAALKYFIMGAVASAFLTFGIALLYAATGSLNMALSLDIAFVTPERTLVFLAMAFLLVGIGFKLSLVPFHLWTPDVYQGAAAPVTAFLATGSKIAVFAALINIVLYAADSVLQQLIPVLWIMAAATMIAGNFAALGQQQLKRLLAYSSAAHMGYMLMALPGVENHGVEAVIFYAVVYALMNLGAFGAIGLLSSAKADRNGKDFSDLDDLDDFKGLGYVYPFKSALLGVCLLSLAGFPPTAGFIGKFILFKAALSSGYIILSVIGILTAIISVYYYLKVVAVLYMTNQPKTLHSQDMGLMGDVACASILTMIIWIGLMPSSLINLIYRIVSFLYV